MVISAFPPLKLASPDGLLAVGGDLEIESLLLAYTSGIFPWPIDEETLAWFSPPKRALLFLNEFHISRSLSKLVRKNPFKITFDRDFASVIAACADVKRGSGTWITSEMQAAYLEFHHAGFAHSVEVWNQDRLVGGLYGVSIAKMFAGESMFHLESDASKVALVYLVEHLKGRAIEWIDCQVMTPLFKSFGARMIEREQFLKLLQRALKST